MVPQYPTEKYKPISENTYDVVEIYHALMCDVDRNEFNEIYIKQLAFRYNTGIYLILTDMDAITQWVHELNWNQLPTIFDEIIVVYEDRVEQWLNSSYGCELNEFVYSSEGFDLQEFIMLRNDKVVTPGDKLVIGTIEGTAWYAKTLWEESKDVPPIELNKVLIKQMYHAVEHVFDEFTETDFYKCNYMVDTKVPLTVIFNPVTLWYDILDGYHRLYAAYHMGLPLSVKSIAALPEPDFLDGSLTPAAFTRFEQRRYKTPVAFI